MSAPNWIPDDLDLSEYMQSQEMRQKVRSASEFHHEVQEYLFTEASQSGERLPWRKTADQVRFRSGEVTLWTGMNGHGKSLVIGQVITGITYQRAGTCIASLEMQPKITLARMIKQAAGTGDALSRKYAEDYLRWAGSNLWLYDHVGHARRDKILALIRYCADKLKLKHFVIDSLMKCGIGLEDYDGQAAFVSDLCDIGRDTGMHVHLVAHSKKQINEHAMPGKMDIKGSGTISDLVHNVLTVYRNKRKEADQEAGNHASSGEPDQYIICDKQRNGDWEGRIGLWYDKASRQYVEAHGEHPHNLTEVLP